MKRWLRRLLYLLFFIIWLLVMSFPFVAFLLATQGELQLGSSARNHLRLFLIQEEEADGLGLEWTRPSPQAPSCSRTTVSFFLWEGEGNNVSYCQCYDTLTGDLLSVQESCDAS
jgi:hypothetical protein